jgi:hypothetical protein
MEYLQLRSVSDIVTAFKISVDELVFRIQLRDSELGQSGVRTSRNKGEGEMQGYGQDSSTVHSHFGWRAITD